LAELTSITTFYHSCTWQEEEEGFYKFHETDRASVNPNYAMMASVTCRLLTSAKFPHKWLTSHIPNWAESIAATLGFLVIKYTAAGTEHGAAGSRRTSQLR